MVIGFWGFGYFGVFIFCFLLNMIPFAGPSNMVVAGAIATIFSSVNPLLIGFLVALASSLAKAIHFYFLFFVRERLNEERRTKLELFGRRIERWGMLAAFMAAASPVPDDPIVVPLGLMRYNPAKFLLGFFSGKIIVTTGGAYIGQSIGVSLQSYLGNSLIAIVSVGLTIIITVLLIKKKPSH